ncbi:TRAP-type C4-dicarboxylate transport system, small permease component [Pseudorhodobacter antarcticus]|jgi:TRAP-type C4-dicarboxylate transport system permease small subunit|uniref:TRAP transporter small permease protein n=1 Tax=Pseudorhodobacter antarcticus TaxID=1077947 RepID=A0A1H8L4I6_9RHOB|nr:TRAP transporter small permease subunit [Pseudorhodobacter antarcticus]SEO00035.1 TRAP-type C4-dicarboxylate transport system, small permease component [Pseudorhodobacter antarcticus]
MSRFEDLTYRFCRIGVGISFLVLILTVLTQVLGRTFSSSPVWTEELTRFALLYMVAFGAGLSLRSGDLVNVDVVCDSLPGRWPWRLRLVSTVMTAVLCGLLILPAWKYVSIGVMQTSPAMLLRMDFIHFTVFGLLVTLLLFATFRIYRMVFAGEDGKADIREELE